MKEIKVILWDFDGVIMDSNRIRNMGFENVLKEFPQEQVEKLLAFHHQNGGLSRYVKFKHFFEDIRKEEVTEEDIKNWAQKFSDIMCRHLIDEKLLIRETLNFIKKNHKTYQMHIVSGSDQKELRHICKALGLDNYFNSIHGSPTPKITLVRQILEAHNYAKTKTLLIGDSINDFEAAEKNKIEFLAYNNESLNRYSTMEFSLKA